MKITDVRTAEVKGHGYSTYVRIYTDEGLVGNGECIHGGEGCPQMVHALKRYIIGENPLDVDMLWEKMRRARLFDGAMAGATVTAMTGIEIALWDLAGKALGVPVYRLLGGKFRDRVRLYCDSHAGRDFSPERPFNKELTDYARFEDMLAVSTDGALYERRVYTNRPLSDGYE